ncbi:acetyl-coenzyme A synthetase, partial [Staphylococcus aureus 1110904178]|uniref:AMP-binding enzyme n=1 Tax=Staphylococcus aureus TaxID=1280 RepID=UPI00044BEE7A
NNYRGNCAFFLFKNIKIGLMNFVISPIYYRTEIIKAFVALRKGYEPTDELKEEIRLFVKEGLSAHAAPREIEFKDKLPKTRSGKIMRRVLKAWELNLDAGDLSTME